MDRKGIIAITLAIVTLFAWTFYSQRESQKTAAARAEQVRAAEAAKKAEAPASPTPDAQPATPGGAVPAVPATVGGEPAVEEKIETLPTPSVEFSFTNLGGGIAKASLLKHEGESGRRMTLNEFGKIPIGAVTLTPDADTRVPFTASVEADAITFERTDKSGLQLTKKFTLPQAGDAEEYLATVDVTFTNRGEQPQKVGTYYIHNGSAAQIHQRDQSIYTGFTYDGNSDLVNVGWFGASSFLGMGHAERPVYPEKDPGLGGVRWSGVTNQYFSTIISPVITAKDSTGEHAQRGAAVWARRFVITDEAWEATGRSVEGKSEERYAVEGAMGMPGFELAPGASRTQSFTIYAGPREYSRLARLPNDEDEILEFGWFAFVSKILLNGMNWLNARLGSYAAAIIVLTLIIKLLLWPMQNKATNSMKKMSLLQPKMTEMREKYKDDPARMNTEVMKLYKDYGVNPFAGCLPMLIQLPVFLGFYRMLDKAVELRNAQFLWVPDLSQPDTIWHLPWLGWPLNVLPFLMAGTMLWSMQLSPKSGDPMQQKIFMFMPLIFIVFCYNFASALALYWTVQNLFSVVQLYLTRNQALPTLQKAAAPPKKRK